MSLGPYTGAVAYSVDWAMVSAVTLTVLGLLRSRDQIGRFAVIGLMQTTLSEALSLALVVFVAQTADEYILGELLGQVATLAVGLILVAPARVRRRDISELRGVVSFGAPLIPVALASFVRSGGRATGGQRRHRAGRRRTVCSREQCRIDCDPAALRSVRELDAADLRDAGSRGSHGCADAEPQRSVHPAHPAHCGSLRGVAVAVADLGAGQLQTRRAPVIRGDDRHLDLPLMPALRPEAVRSCVPARHGRQQPSP